jgi:hypothetical protein
MEGLESKCSFCRKDYDEDNHIPVALVCGHSYGRSCAFMNFRDNMIRCCECGEIEQRNPIGIPVNYSLRELIEFRARQIMDKEIILKSLNEKIDYYQYKYKADSDLVTDCIRRNDETYKTSISVLDKYIKLLGEIKLNIQKTYNQEQILISDNTTKYKTILQSNISYLKNCVNNIQRCDNLQNIQFEYDATMKLIKAKATETKLELKKFQFPNFESILDNSISNLITSFDWDSDKITVYLELPSNPSIPSSPRVIPPIASVPSSPNDPDTIPIENISPIRGFLSIFHQRHSQ